MSVLLEVIVGPLAVTVNRRIFSEKTGEYDSSHAVHMSAFGQ